MKVLLIIPSYRETIYRNVKVRVGRIDSPVLSLPVLAGMLLRYKHEVKILDCNLFSDASRAVENEIRQFKPHVAGITVVTPLFKEMAVLAETVKKTDPTVTVVVGGPHVSAMPEEALALGTVDIVVIGEGDETILEIADQKERAAIAGIAYCERGAVVRTQPRPPNLDLDKLPYPAWHLYDLKKYATSPLMSRRSPAGWLETSRGCPFNCCYCNKNVFGRHFRAKSPGRTVDEMASMLSAGFKEIHIADDMFTTDIKRVKDICDEIVARKLRFPWATVTGIRVDRGDEEMFAKMAAAGCYRVYLGIESGNQAVLDTIQKKITLDQVRRIIPMARKAGLEICGFFMFALPGETVAAMQDTIDFAVSLDLDFAKASITTPLPATALFKELDAAGRIKTKDWSKYNLYLPANNIYEHPNLSWETVQKYYDRFYRRFYFRWSYFVKTFFRGIRTGHLLNYLL
ncbi:MAG: radical SAM protein, partial [Chitinivibrionales bacterium]|nr:radical SAM protein [Chitinivibrionales bacterium]